VVAQETGVSELYPVGSGLVTFSEPDEAAAALARVAADYERHCAAARALAEQHFRAEAVVGRLLEELGVR